VNGASVSTATATTGIAEGTPYVGRFAPSPTGPLHLGSLVAAVGSFVDARSRGGRWLVRIEDLDRARAVRGCVEQMLRTLADFGLTWDGAIAYQSERTAHYARALQTLQGQQLTFECSCSRREQHDSPGYPGTCRSAPSRSGPTATRFRVTDIDVVFEDRAQGRCVFALGERGDVIIRRRDGEFAYQLAVVVDDALQGITDVVRGADLLDSTPWQIALQRALGLPPTRYLHLPLVTEPDGEKLSKSRRSIQIDRHRPAGLLYEALMLLRQEPPAELQHETQSKVLEWACSHWSVKAFQTVRNVGAPIPRNG
jgi:glutamyl-Q tRNA(Asp) synthetase